jgi:hypothetical protein
MDTVEFIADSEDIRILIDYKIEVYYGFSEKRNNGKQLEVYGVITRNMLKLVTDNPEIIEVLENNDIFKYVDDNPLDQEITIKYKNTLDKKLSERYFVSVADVIAHIKGKSND